ncbi:ABC transporter ATP-binding protein [Paenibacillus sp. FSL M8-0228]|jgi:ABC-type bacteriocin/lantibiotic exporter with double-glycine peptidase domain|uniref:ATP-binding cassette domain-containing protein n=1 Tax=Paenibacillus TaxID=44249 RepID=UPI00083CB057|nr:ABC transporter ATP-binding protein [Paenibacillus polymyxa]MBO3285475.1 ATP-binding cassette domain-containing protein [Paenibacillus polymyxa]ODB54474.1 ABC transporter ATP-binding protein [Paenibacillus polymyxa]
MNIEFKNVSYSYNGLEKALSDVSFSIHGNHIFCLSGRNGAGKSTLLKLLTKINCNYTGDILVNEKEMREWKRKDIISKIGICFQEPVMYVDTIFNNITLGQPGIPIRQLNSYIELLDTKKFIEESKKDQIIGKNFSLSGGQQQLISILRNIYTNKEVLIFDEPTSNLDGVVKKNFIDLLDDLKYNHTIILITHDSELGSKYEQILL